MNRGVRSGKCDSRATKEARSAVKLLLSNLSEDRARELTMLQYLRFSDIKERVREYVKKNYDRLFDLVRTRFKISAKDIDHEEIEDCISNDEELYNMAISEGVEDI